MDQIIKPVINSFNGPPPVYTRFCCAKSLHIIIIIRFLINVQVQGQHPHQWATFQIAGLLQAWQISHQISRHVHHEG